MSIEISATEITEKDAAEAMALYIVARADEKEAAQRKDIAARVIKSYLGDDPSNLRALEYEGVTARLVARKTAGQMDWASMSEHDIVALARVGCFQPVAAATLASIVKPFPAVADVLKRYQMPGGETLSLEVK